MRVISIIVAIGFGLLTLGLLTPSRVTKVRVGAPKPPPQVAIVPPSGKVVHNPWAPPWEEAKSGRPAPEPVGMPAPRVELPNPTWTVESRWMSTRADALQDALREAQAEIVAYLRNQQPPVDWTPPVDYIQLRLVKQPWQEEPKEFDGLGTMYRVRLRAEIGPVERSEMLERGRATRSEQRMLLLGKMLLGLVAVLGAVAGFLRLDERTKGFYTGWLKLAAVGFAGAVVVGLLLWK